MFDNTVHKRQGVKTGCDKLNCRGTDPSTDFHTRRVKDAISGLLGVRKLKNNIFCFLRVQRIFTNVKNLTKSKVMNSGSVVISCLSEEKKISHKVRCVGGSSSPLRRVEQARVKPNFASIRPTWRRPIDWLR